jgi:hypothetical protein
LGAGLPFGRLVPGPGRSSAKKEIEIEGKIYLEFPHSTPNSKKLNML